MLVLYNWSTKICTLVIVGTQMVALDGFTKEKLPFFIIYESSSQIKSLDVQPWSPPLEQAILWLVLSL
jgi:hypothetical protein